MNRLHESGSELESTDVPVLVVMGRCDFAVPCTLWSERSPGRSTTVRILGRSGHTPQLEQPEVFDELLLGWLHAESDGA